jgi:hypothetical protein
LVRHIFQACPCGYTLSVTSQASYLPEYITPTPKKIKTPILLKNVRFHFYLQQK